MGQCGTFLQFLADMLHFARGGGGLDPPPPPSAQATPPPLIYIKGGRVYMPQNLICGRTKWFNMQAMHVQRRVTYCCPRPQNGPHNTGCTPGSMEGQRRANATFTLMQQQHAKQAKSDIHPRHRARCCRQERGCGLPSAAAMICNGVHFQRVIAPFCTSKHFGSCCCTGRPPERC